MSNKRHFKFWLPLVVAFAAACGGPSTTSNLDGGGIPDAPADVTVAELPVDFGFGDCGGAAAAPKSVKIENKGGGTVSWTAEIELPGFTVVGATSGTFTGGGAVNVNVRPAAIAPVATAGTELRATLLVIIDKQKIFRVPLRVVAQGGTLTVNPVDAAFGEMPLNVQAPDIPVTIKNTGNKEVTLSLASPGATDFGVTLGTMASEVKVAPGATIPGAAARFRPSKLTQQTTAAPMKVKGAVCGASATTVPMSGKGTGGVVGISPGLLDFGRVNCGGRGSVRSIIISNLGNQAFDWTAALLSGANFDLSLPGGTILAGSQVQVSVTPKDIPAVSAITNNLYGDTLNITTTAPNSTPVDIPLLMTAQGAILNFATLPGDYGTRGLFGPALARTVGVSNTGNGNATVMLTSTSTAYATPAAFSVVAASTTNTSVSFTPITFGDNNGDLTMSTSGVICQPLPGSTPLTGKGRGIASFVSVGSAGRQSEDGASACAVLTGGRVACWGDNRYGQLGIGSVNPTNSGTPLVIPSFANAVTLAGAGEFNCARTTAGTVFCWGRNSNRNNRTTGQLGAGGGDKSSPTLVAGLTNVISLSAAERHACAVSTMVAGGTSGRILCWGTNRRGNLGTGTISDSSAPVQVFGITDAISVTASATGGCARRVGNVVSCWGQNNSHGQLGNGSTVSNGTGGPVAVVSLANAASVSAGGPGSRTGLTCAAQTTGGVVCWGDNRAPNRFGGGTIGKITGAVNTQSNDQSTPFAIPGVAGATAVTAGQRHACALVAGGAGVCWGVGGNGELGNGSTTGVSPAVTVTGLAGATQISAAGCATCAVLNTGAVTCWGMNNSGQLGNPAAAGTTPTVVSGF